MPMLNMLTRKLFSGRVGLGAAAPGTRRCVSRRQFSRSAFLASDIDASKLKVTANSESKPKPAKEDLVFGKEFTDHYLVIDYSEGKGGWGAPEIIPYGPMALAPSASVLHYALECFEGMKAYKDADGNTRLFRPDCNMERLNSSMNRLGMPSFDGEQLTECIKQLLRQDESWIPEGEGFSMYIRPTAISTTEWIGVGAPTDVRIFVLLSPVGPYYPRGFVPVRLYASTEYVRAWPGGAGFTKVGGNYAPTILPQREAAGKGYDQILWLYDNVRTGQKEVTEVGTMNMFTFWERESDGKRELVTAPLDGTILPGVTRRSVLDLAKSWGEFEVTERTYCVSELTRAADEGRLIECFGTGTAASVSPIESFHFDGKDYEVPLALGKMGELTQRVHATINDIQYGKIDGPEGWSVVV